MPLPKPSSETSEQPASKHEMSSVKLEDQRNSLAKQREYLEALKLENQKLKEELLLEKQKTQFMESQIEIENKPLGYNFSSFG